jgi:hypothetical protein
LRREWVLGYLFVWGGASLIATIVALILSYVALKGSSTQDYQTRTRRYWAYFIALLSTPFMTFAAVFVIRLSDASGVGFDAFVIPLFFASGLGILTFLLYLLADGKTRCILGYLSAGVLHSIPITLSAIPVQITEYDESARKAEMAAQKVAVENIQKVAAEKELANLCKSAEAKILVRIDPAEGLVVPVTSEWRGRYFVDWLVRGTQLRFVERARADGESYRFREHPGQYVRVSDSGVRQGSASDYDIVPIEAPAGEYRLESSDVQGAGKSWTGVEGARVEIRRVEDDRLIGYVRYYWQSYFGLGCPDSSKHDAWNPFVRDFLLDVLNVRKSLDPDVAKR